MDISELALLWAIDQVLSSFVSKFSMVVDDLIKIMLTTLDFNMDLYQAFKHKNMETKRSCYFKKANFSLLANLYFEKCLLTIKTYI